MNREPPLIFLRSPFERPPLAWMGLASIISIHVNHMVTQLFIRAAILKKQGRDG